VTEKSEGLKTYVGSFGSGASDRKRSLSASSTASSRAYRTARASVDDSRSCSASKRTSTRKSATKLPVRACCFLSIIRINGNKIVTLVLVPARSNRFTHPLTTASTARQMQQQQKYIRPPWSTRTRILYLPSRI
jgi:hypothetical protein